MVNLYPGSRLIVKGSTNITSKESKTSEDVIQMDSSFAEFVGGITVQNSNLNELASLNKTHLKTSKFDVINNKTFNSTLFISIGESEFEIANENNTYADINIEGLEVFTSSQLHDLPYFELFYIDDKGVIKARNINVKEVIVKDDTVHHDFYVFYGQYEPSVIANNITIDTIKTHAKELNAFNLCYQSNISSHNKEKLNILIKNIQSDIQASTDQENDAYRVFGIYSEASTITGSVDLTIECITSNDHGAGIFALQQSSFTLGKTSIKNVTGGMNALGIVLQQGSRIQFNKSLEIDGIISENGSAVGLLAEDLTLNKGISITNISGKQHSYAVAAYSENPNQEKHRILISNERPDTLNVIEGDMLAAQNCEIDAEFINENSHFIGATKQLSSADLGTDGIISASFDNGSYWLVTDNSSMTNLTVGGNSYVDLGYSGASKTPKSHKVITKNFTATDGGKLIFNVDAANQDNTSQLIVDGEASGNFTAQLNVVNGNQLTNGSTWVISQNAGELTLDKDDISYQAGGATAYSLAFREDASGDADGVTTSTGNPGKWYLVHPLTDPDQGGQEGGGNNGNDGDNAGGSGSGSGNGSGSGSQKPPVTPEVDQMLSLGTSVAQATGMLNENEDLRLRMGDVRHGATDGLWVRTYARKDRAQGSFGNGFEQDTYGIHIGADHILTSDARSSWLLGGAFHYGQSDIDGAAEAGGGSADVDQYTFKGYATYMHDTGTFADFVIHAGYYDTELKGLNNPGTKNYKANFSNWGYGLSAEVGHRFEFGDVNPWYIEPTAQFSWFHAEGKRFQTSTGLAIEQSNADFLTGRLGAAIGKTFALGTDSDPYAQYVSIAMKGGMLFQFDGDQTLTAHGTDGTTVTADAMDMKGARAYYGVTADWKIDDTWRIYGQVSREEGSGYTKDYEASIGLRYAF